MQTDSSHIFLIGALPPPITGQSVAFEMLVKHLKDQNHPITVVNISPPEQNRADGTFSLGRAASFAMPFLHSLAMLFKRRRTAYLTIAQSFSGFLRDLAFISLARLGGHRIVLHLHGGNYKSFYSAQSRFVRKAIAWACSCADRIIVLADCFKQEFDFLPDHERKIAVVPNGLPADNNELPTTPKSLPPPGAPLKILFLSNLMESKGYLDVFDALEIIHSRGIAFECDFCGSFQVASDSNLYTSARSAERHFIEKIRKSGMQGSIRWRSVLTGSDKWTAFRNCHFFVLPTYYNNEGQPISVIEALAFGCVVVASRHRAIPEMLGHGEAGVLVSPRNPQEIADAIISSSADNRHYERLSARAMERYQRFFTRDAHLARLTSVIMNVQPQV